MYQNKINKELNYDVFKLPDCKITGKFIHGSSYRRARRLNTYENYLTKANTSASIDTILKSIAYNTDKEPFIWNHKSNYLYFYERKGTELVETLPHQLSEKIKRNIPDEIFRSRIYDILFNYHILINKNGDIIPFEKYPSIYISGGYFETFPTIYIEEDLTPSEIGKISAMASGRNIIINLDDKIKLVKLKGKAHDPSGDKSTLLTFDKNNEGLIKLTLAIALHNKNKLTSLFNQLEKNPELVKKLSNILKITTSFP